jgi:hypothetical protein
MSRALPRAASLRARRWDVVVLGGALPGLAAAIRLGMGGLRVLVVEEDACARTPDLVREPFFLPGGFGDGIVDACLRSLGIPVIDRRELVASDLAYQVLLPDARIDVGGAHATAEELTAWGLAKPETAQALARQLAEAARAEGEALLAADAARAHALRAGRKAPTLAVAARGLPAGMRELEAPLARFFALQLRALSNLGESTPSPEAQARLLGSALLGGTSLADPHGGLRALLRRRLATLHAEFRTLTGAFQFVEVSDHPGIAREQAGDVWIGRAVLLNAPRARLAAAQRDWGFEVPRFLDGAAPSARRFHLHLRALAEAIPEPLAARALLASDTLPNGVALSVLPSPRGGRFAEIVARTVAGESEADAAVAARLREAIGELIPPGDPRVAAAPPAERPLWDDEAALVDPERGEGFGALPPLRAGGRRPVYRLPREAGAAFGVEGDLLLGCQVGDAIRGELG